MIVLVAGRVVFISGAAPPYVVVLVLHRRPNRFLGNHLSVCPRSVAVLADNVCRACEEDMVMLEKMVLPGGLKLSYLS